MTVLVASLARTTMDVASAVEGVSSVVDVAVVDPAMTVIAVV